MRALCLMMAMALATMAVLVAMASGADHFEQLAQLERLIRAPYPECCSARHVSELLFVQSAMANNDNEQQQVNEHQMEEAQRRFTQYLPLLHAYCNRLLDMKIAKKDNLQLLTNAYGQVTDITKKLVLIQRKLNIEDMPEERFLAEIGQYLSALSQKKSISERQALAELKEAAKKLGRLINVEMAPVLTLEMVSNSMGPDNEQHQITSTLTRDWAATSEQCTKIRLTTMDSSGQLELNEYLPEVEEEAEDGYEGQSPLAPLNSMMVRQLTAEEGYKRKFDQLATGLVPAARRQS